MYKYVFCVSTVNFAVIKRVVGDVTVLIKIFTSCTVKIELTQEFVTVHTWEIHVYTVCKIKHGMKKQDFYGVS